MKMIETRKIDVLDNSIKASQQTILTLEVKDKDGFSIGIFKGYKEAAMILGLNEKTIRNIAHGKFKSNRKGYTITAVAKGGVAL